MSKVGEDIHFPIAFGEPLDPQVVGPPSVTLRRNSNACLLPSKPQCPQILLLLKLRMFVYYHII